MELIVEATTKLGFKPKGVKADTPVKPTTTTTVSQVEKGVKRNTTMSKVGGVGGSDRLTKEEFEQLGHAEKLVRCLMDDLTQTFAKRLVKAKSYRSKWDKDMETAYAFYSKRQWDEESMQKLKEEQRPALTFNVIRPIVNVVSGSIN